MDSGAAAMALRAAGREAETAVPDLRKALAHPDWAVRTVAADALCEIVTPPPARRLRPGRSRRWRAGVAPPWALPTVGAVDRYACLVMNGQLEAISAWLSSAKSGRKWSRRSTSAPRWASTTSMRTG